VYISGLWFGLAAITFCKSR